MKFLSLSLLIPIRIQNLDHESLLSSYFSQTRNRFVDFNEEEAEKRESSFFSSFSFSFFFLFLFFFLRRNHIFIMGRAGPLAFARI